jgi:hypothetical protein
MFRTARILTYHVAKKNRQEEQAKRAANDKDISEYFKGANRAQPKPKVHIPFVRSWIDPTKYLFRSSRQRRTTTSFQISSARSTTTFLPLLPISQESKDLAVVARLGPFHLLLSLFPKRPRPSILGYRPLSHQPLKKKMASFPPSTMTSSRLPISP